MIFAILQRLSKRWRDLLDHCQIRMECNSDSGDYSTMLYLFKKVIRSAKGSRVADPVKNKAQALRRTLKSIFHLIKTHCVNGNSGVATVLYNELSGLAGSSTIRRVNKTLQQTFGAARGRLSSNTRSDSPTAVQASFPTNTGQTAGRGGRGAFQGNFRRNFPNNRGNAGGAAGGRRVMRCFICNVVGHGFQQCPQRPDSTS